MPIFVTFYSFKGGVGRTLALANVATLLAKDPDEPCRVLAWDFDLAAPGLQQVFRCLWRDTRAGFVDYVDHYLTHADIDNVRDYIYPTDVEGVDILPAGSSDRAYAEKLEQIHWGEMYERQRGYDFIEAVKKAISDLSPSYDYVLVDSLTGYSDVGGICVQQIPDVVVLLFRPNRQNLTGIKKVYEAIRAAAERKSRPIQVVPVISPAWPFAYDEASDWLKKAEDIFGDVRIRQLSFEASLSFGEKIISRRRSRRIIAPRILADYQALTSDLRDSNPRDRKTMFYNIRKFREDSQFSEALETCIKLVKQRPDQSLYWRQLVSTVSLAPKLLRNTMRDKATKVISDACEQRVPQAYVARAELSDQSEGAWEDAFRDFTQAIELDRESLENYFLRGAACLRHRQYAQAIVDFSNIIEKRKPRFLAVAYFQRALCLMATGQMEPAIQDISEAIKLQPLDTHWLLHRAKALYAASRYQDAEAEVRKILEISPSDYDTRTFRAHLLSAMGRTDEATAELRSLEATVPHFGYVLNIAEAYLTVDPKQVFRLLHDEEVGEYPPLAHSLKLLAAILMGDSEREKEQRVACEAVAKEIQESGWSFLELRHFLSWGKDRGLFDEDKRQLLDQLIEAFEGRPQAAAQPPNGPAAL